MRKPPVWNRKWKNGNASTNQNIVLTWNIKNFKHIKLEDKKETIKSWECFFITPFHLQKTSKKQAEKHTAQWSISIHTPPENWNSIFTKLHPVNSFICSTSFVINIRRKLQNTTGHRNSCLRLVFEKKVIEIRNDEPYCKHQNNNSTGATWIDNQKYEMIYKIFKRDTWSSKQLKNGASNTPLRKVKKNNQKLTE